MAEDCEKMVQLVKHIEDHPCLFDYNRADYSNDTVKTAAWHEIAKEINLSVADCKEKWRNIHGRYLRQLKDVPPSGSGTKRKKVYYLTDYLHFIDPYTTSRPQTGNLTGLTVSENRGENSIDYLEVDEIEYGYEHEEKSMTDTHSINKCIKKKSGIDSSSKKQQCSSLDELNVAAAGYFKEKRSQKKSEELQDHDMDFLKSLLPDIKSLDSHNKRKLKINIMQLVDDACKEASYNQNTNVHNIHDTLSYSRQPSQDQQPLSNFQQRELYYNQPPQLFSHLERPPSSYDKEPPIQQQRSTHHKHEIDPMTQYKPPATHAPIWTPL
ncbi:uncharacterized protein LOC111033763 [Myzus persicae]|uniref:uncharacterized protein LOC111033763 n=1 Tax=Myzus persicae TaxID=13164 RepID=UPI000B930EDA|nr:uncharacterized protein LOC111033763 [Myzus persicae]